MPMNTNNAAEDWASSPFPEREYIKWNASEADRSSNGSQLMKRAILEDPYVLFPKESVEPLSRIAGETPEMQKKTDILALKYAGAQYLANHYKLPFESVLTSYDKITENYFGEKLNPQQVYLRLRDGIRKKEEPGYWTRRAIDAGTGLLQTAKGMQDMGQVFVFRPLAEMNHAVNGVVYGGMEYAARKLGYRDAADWFKGMADRRDSWLDRIAEDRSWRGVLEETAKGNEEAKGSADGFFEKLSAGVVQNLPNMLLTLGFAELKAGMFAAGSLYYGVSSFAGELEDTRYDRNMTEEGKVINAVVVGAAEAIFEEISGVGKIARKYWRKTLPEKEIRRISSGFVKTSLRALRSLGMDAVGEGGEEVLTGITQRFSNLLFHKEGKDLARMSAEEIFHEICDPVPLEFSVGGVMGFGMGGVGFNHRRKLFKSQAEAQNFRADMIGAAKDALSKLKGKENPSAEEMKLAEKLETAIENGNVERSGGLIDIAREEMQRAMESRKEDELNEYDYARKLEAEGVNEWNMLEAETKEEGEAEAETVQRIFDDMRKRFSPDLNIELADTASLPDGLRERVEKKKGAEGVWSDGKIYLLSDRIRAGRVRKVFIHEAAAHEGLRRVFGENYDDFLREVVTEFSDGVSETARARGIDITTAAGQLEAADEYLAKLAEERIDPENPGERGSIWKRILYKFRAWLRRHGFDIAWTDNELTELLRDGARAVGEMMNDERGMMNVSATQAGDGGERFALFDNYKKSVQVINALKRIAGGEEEVVVNNLRDDLQQYGGTNDVSFSWGNEKKGIYHIAYRRGIDTLFHVLDAVSDGKILRYVNGNKTVILEKDGYEAVLALTEFGKQKSWLLSGWKTNLPDAIGEVGAQSDATQLKPTFSRQELGAGIESIVASHFGKVKGDGEKNTRFSVSPVWTGSAADYEKPSLHYVGSGEGAQVYGWGLYGSSSKEVAQWYAEVDAERKNFGGLKNRITINGEEFSTFYDTDEEPYNEELYSKLEKFLEKNPIEGMTPVKLYVIINSVLMMTDTLTFHESALNTVRDYEDFYGISSPDYAAAKMLADMSTPEGKYGFKIGEPLLRRNLYRQTFWPGKEENLLDWDKAVPERQIQQIREALKKSDESDLSDWADSSVFTNASGGQLYNQLVTLTGSPKAASEFLYRAGIDGVTYLGDSSGVRNYVAFSDQDIKVDEHIRFAAGEDPGFDAKVSAISKVLFRYTGTLSMIEPEEAYDILSKKGWKIDLENDEELLRRGAVEAMMLKRKRSQENRKKREKHAVAKADEWTGLLMEKYGEDFKINAGPKYDEIIRKEPFTGTWIDRRKTERGRNGSISAEEAAKYLTEKTGKEVTADMVVSHFGDLKKEGLLADYRARRRKKSELWNIEQEIEEEERQAEGMEPFSSKPIEESEYRKKLRKAYEAEKAKEEQADIEKWLYDNVEIWRWVADVVGSTTLRHGFILRPAYRFQGEEFTGNFIAKEWRRYSEGHPGKRTGKALQDYEALREKNLRNAPGKHSDELAKEIAAKTGGDELKIEEELIEFFRHLKREDLRNMYREAKREEKRAEQAELSEADYKEGSGAAAEHYKALLELARNDRVNIIQIQSAAAAYARKHLPEEMRGVFLQRIADLSKYDSTETRAYPEGRRQYELDKLLADMQTYRIRDQIRALLYGTRVRVKNGRPTQPLGEAKETVDEIRRIVSTPVYAVETMLAHLKEEQQAALTGEVPNQAKADELGEKIALWDTFGKLELKTKEENLEALRMLRHIIDGDRTGLLAKLKEKRTELKWTRHQAKQEITGSAVPRIGRHVEEPAKQPWKFTLMNSSLRTLIELVNQNSGKKFDDTVLGGIYGRIEEATQKGATRDRENSERSLAKIKEIFGLKNLLQQSRFWKESERIPEHTGIMIERYYTETGINGEPNEIIDRRGAEKGYISVKNARELLKNIEEGKAKLPALSVEFLRQQLNDFDLGIERTWDIFHNPDEDANFQSFAEKGKVPEERRGKIGREALEKETKLVVLKPERGAKSETKEVLISKAEGANILMQWEQPDIRARMEWNGWSEKSIEQLKNYIGQDFIRLAYWMREEVAQTGKLVDGEARELYGCGLPHIENYFPASYNESLGKQMNSDPLLGDTFGQMTVNPTFLISRRFHLADIDIHRSIFQAFFRHQAEANHFIAYGRVIRECRSILNDAGVRSAISQEYGSNVYNALIDRVDLVANGGRAKCEAAEWLGKLFRYWVPAKIAINSSSILKQIAGSASYMNGIPVKDFVRGVYESATGSEEFKRFYEAAKESDYFKNRMAGGLNSDVMYLMMSARSGKVEDSIGNALIDKGTYLTKWADGIAALRAGYSVFRYHYQNALKSGRSETEAWDEAMKAWKRATDETQQSGYMKDQNYFQSNSVYYKYFTAFLSNPIQIMNLELMTLNRIIYGKGNWQEKLKGDAGKQLLHQVLVNHVLVPTIMTAITQFLSHGFDLEDYEWEDFLTGFLLGPFEGAFIAGKAFQAIAGEFWMLMRHKKNFGRSTFNAFPQLDEGINGMLKIKKVFTKEGPTAIDYMNAVQGFGDLTAIGGSAPLPFAGAAGGMLSAAMRELKRWYRIMIPEQDK